VSTSRVGGSGLAGEADTPASTVLAPHADWLAERLASAVAERGARTVEPAVPDADDVVHVRHGDAAPQLAGLVPRGGVGSHIARRAGASRRLMRVIDDRTLEAAVDLQTDLDTDDYKELLPALSVMTDALVNFVFIPVNERELPPHQPALAGLLGSSMALTKQAVQLSEDRAELVTDPRQQGPLGRVKKLASGIEREVNEISKRLGSAAKGQRHDTEVQPRTERALEAGLAQHLLITPRPGTREAEGAGQLYPTGVTPEQEMTMALPATTHERSRFLDLKVSGAQGGPLELLAIGGGHGGVNALFEQQGQGVFYKSWWKTNVIDPLVKHGVRAKLVVLDACLTASMIDVFAPLCTPDGRVIASMYSINTRLLTPEVLAEILEAEKASAPVAPIIEKRARYVAEHASEDAAAALVGGIRSNPPDEVEALVKQVPALMPIVSRVRYLARLSDSASSYVRARTDVRRTQVRKEITDLLTSRPPPEAPEAEAIDIVLQMIDDGAADMAVEFMRDRIQAITKTTDTDLAALERALRLSSIASLVGTPETEVPAQFAAFDVASRDLLFDKLFTDPQGRENVILTTAELSRDEMNRIQATLEDFRDKGLVNLRPVATKAILP
jgi:hypothetical protein